jgi:lysophospholipase L1-like esterase
VQSGTQATMSAVATGTFSGTTATIGTLAAAVPAAAGVFAARRPGRVVNIIGDSIAPQQNATITQYGADGALAVTSGNSLLWAHLLSDGQILVGKQAGIGSQRIEHMIQRLYNDVLVYPAQFCIIQTGTNDLSAGTSTAAWAGYIQQMCAALLAVGQTPVLVTCPPVPSAYRSAADKYRRWIVAFALRNGLPLVDAYSALADTTGTGGYASGLDSGDGIHPSAAGYRAYGQAIVDALAGHLLPGNPPVARVNAIASSGSLVDNGLFLTDTNSDGVPDGWTKSGTGAGVSSIVTGDSAIVGNAMRLVDTGNTGSVTYAYTTSATTPVGGRVRVQRPNQDRRERSGSTHRLRRWRFPRPWPRLLRDHRFWGHQRDQRLEEVLSGGAEHHRHHARRENRIHCTRRRGHRRLDRADRRARPVRARAVIPTESR